MVFGGESYDVTFLQQDPNASGPGWYADAGFKKCIRVTTSGSSVEHKIVINGTLRATHNAPHIFVATWSRETASRSMIFAVLPAATSGKYMRCTKGSHVMQRKMQQKNSAMKTSGTRLRMQLRVTSGRSQMIWCKHMRLVSLMTIRLSSSS